MRQKRFSLRRFRAVLVKEVLQMLRDRITFAMMIGGPIMQLMLFGYAINNDPKHLPAALVATSQDRFTRAIVTTLGNTGHYRFDHVMTSAQDAEKLLEKGRFRSLSPSLRISRRASFPATRRAC